MTKFGCEFIKLKGDDFGVKPKFFQNEIDGYASLIRHDNCGMIHCGDDRPHFYFRNMNMESYRWAGFVKLGEKPLDYQIRGSYKEIVQDIKCEPYRQISNNPETYKISSEETSFTYNENGCEWIEDDVLNVKGEWFPYALVMHSDSAYHNPFVNLPVVLNGTYNNKKTDILGCIDRIYAPETNSSMSGAFSYISAYLLGIREDGRREMCMTQLNGNQNGHGIGAYWLEGEEPVISEDVWLEGEFERLPYVDDDTCVCVNEIWRFGGKEFHCHGKWGSKGFTSKPRIERHGQSQMFGTWYEGPTAYNHKLYDMFNESMDCYSDRIIKLGLKVK